MLSGGFVAGLDAGLVHNTFPRMGSDWIPPDLFAASPWWLNPFENRTTVQFDHRVLAYLLLAVVTALWWGCARHAPGAALKWAHAGFAAVWMQAVLGVATLLLFVPSPRGAPSSERARPLHRAPGPDLRTAALLAGLQQRHVAETPAAQTLTMARVPAGRDASSTTVWERMRAPVAPKG